MGTGIKGENYLWSTLKRDPEWMRASVEGFELKTCKNRDSLVFAFLLWVVILRNGKGQKSNNDKI